MVVRTTSSHHPLLIFNLTSDRSHELCSSCFTEDQLRFQAHVLSPKSQLIRASGARRNSVEERTRFLKCNLSGVYSNDDDEALAEMLSAAFRHYLKLGDNHVIYSNNEDPLASALPALKSGPTNTAASRRNTLTASH